MCSASSFIEFQKILIGGCAQGAFIKSKNLLSALANPPEGAVGAFRGNNRRRRFFLRLCELHDFCKRIRMACREIGKHLAVDTNLFLFQRRNQLGICHTVDARTRIDTGDPQLPELPFLRFAVPVRMLSGFIDVMFGNSEYLTSSAPITFRLG